MENRTINIVKTVSEKFPADRVTATVSAVGNDKKYADAADRADALADAAVAALKTAGVTDIRALGINVSAVREGKKTVGYRAARTFSAVFDFDKSLLARVTDALGDSGCEWRINFSLKDSKKPDELLARAVKASRSDAEVIAKAAGVKISGLFSVSYSSSDSAAPRVMFMRACNADGAASDIEPELIEVSVTVDAKWEID